MTGGEANLSNQEGSNHSGRSPLMNHIPQFEWSGTEEGEKTATSKAQLDGEELGEEELV